MHSHTYRYIASGTLYSVAVNVNVNRQRVGKWWEMYQSPRICRVQWPHRINETKKFKRKKQQQQQQLHNDDSVTRVHTTQRSKCSCTPHNAWAWKQKKSRSEC